MRKLKKLSLDELEKTMPVISELKQNEFVGATHYFDPSGNFLATYGSSDDIQVIDPTDFYFGNFSAATPLDSSSTSSQWAVVMHYLSGFAWADSGVQVAPNTPSDAQAGFMPNGTFFVKEGSYILKNESDLLNTLWHEEYHYSNNFIVDPAEEVSAIYAQISHATYLDTSDDYRKKVADYLYLQWGKQNVADDSNNHSIDDARAIACVLGYGSY